MCLLWNPISVGNLSLQEAATGLPVQQRAAPASNKRHSVIKMVTCLPYQEHQTKQHILDVKMHLARMHLLFPLVDKTGRTSERMAYLAHSHRLPIVIVWKYTPDQSLNMIKWLCTSSVLERNLYLESIPGKLGMRQEYMLGGTPAHHKTI